MSIVPQHGLGNLNREKSTLQLPYKTNSSDVSDEMASNYFKGSSMDSQYIHADVIIVALSQQ